MTKYQITYELEAENLNDATTAAYLLLFDTDVEIDSVYVAPLPCTCDEPEADPKNTMNGFFEEPLSFTFNNIEPSPGFYDLLFPTNPPNRTAVIGPA